MGACDESLKHEGKTVESEVTDGHRNTGTKLVHKMLRTCNG